METTLALSLVTPEATFFSGDATLVEAPGTEGDFGVLPGHMDFISTLKAGVVTIHNNNEVETQVFICGGIAEVNARSCTILAEKVIDLAQITAADADARLAKAKAAFEAASGDAAKEVAEREVELAEAIVEALSAA